MEEVRELVLEVKAAMLAALSILVLKGLDEAIVVMNNQVSLNPDGQKIQKDKDSVLERFQKHAGNNFDELVGGPEKEVNVLDYGSLSLVEEDDLEAIIAMEGMIAHARNCDIQEYLSFNTRFDTLFFGTRIDESNNPMDPEQIGDAFKEAIRPVSLSPAGLLMAYRYFNSSVFHELEAVFVEANEILIGKNILPDLDIAARDKKVQKNKRSLPREKKDPTERAFSSPSQAGDQPGPSAQQMFSVMQNLMHGMSQQGQQGASGNIPTNAGVANAGQVATATAGNAAMPGGQAAYSGMIPMGLQQGMMIGNQRVEMVANEQLVNLLSEIQQNFTEQKDDQNGDNDSEEEGAVSSAPINLGKSIGDLLQNRSDEETLRALDSQSSDVINLVTLLFEAIWEDETVPIPVKEIIGRTQITILRIALNDSGFFDRDDHPARVLINELATAGISWTEFDKLESDPMYRKMQSIVGNLLKNYDNDLELIDGLNHEFIMFKRNQMLEVQETEQRLSDVHERQNRIDEVKEYALGKIAERILDEEIQPFVKEFLETHFHKFVVQVVLREGPGGISWKPIMNTVDVLLWTVNRGKQEGDMDRFVKVNPRLLVNLRKALEIAGIEKSDTDSLISELQKVQNSTFSDPTGDSVSAKTASDEEAGAEEDVAQKPLPPLPEDDAHLQEVSNYPIGIWLEFQTEGDQTVRCTLAAKIDTIDKYVFVNRQGVKVIENSKMGLARELKAGSVKVISESPLIERAMETVIGRLRDSGASNQSA
jgi:hypothetical protein